MLIGNKFLAIKNHKHYAPPTGMSLLKLQFRSTEFWSTFRTLCVCKQKQR